MTLILNFTFPGLLGHILPLGDGEHNVLKPGLSQVTQNDRVRVEDGQETWVPDSAALGGQKTVA